MNEAVRRVRGAEESRRRMYGGWVPEELRDRGAALGLLVDFENLVLGAAASLPGRAEPVPDRALTWLCRAYGPTTIRRAYADWADHRFGRYQPALERNGIDLVQIGHGPGRKNGADIRMAVDAMEVLIVHPAVDAFVLVSGDSDFSPLVAKLREHGKYVIGVGAETAASARLVAAVSEYKLFGSIVDQLDPQQPTPAAGSGATSTPVPDTATDGAAAASREDDQPHTTAAAAADAGDTRTEDAEVTSFGWAEAEQLLVNAIDQITAATPTAAAVKSKMVALDPTFDPINYGCRSFRDFLAKLDHRVRTVGTSGHDITLALVEPPRL